MEIYFVTSSEDKFNEAQQIIGKKVSLKRINLDLLEPQSIIPLEVSQFKAKQAFEALKKPVIVTDHGVSLSAFNGFPGTMIKYINQYIGQKGILKLLEGVPDRSAKVISSLTFYDGSTMKTFDGVIEGTIANEIYPEGWEFDKIFIPKGSTITFGQMGKERKNQDSHLRRALIQFLEWLEIYKSR